MLDILSDSHQGFDTTGTCEGGGCECETGAFEECSGGIVATCCVYKTELTDGGYI
jgi:hypothetical protein